MDQILGLRGSLHDHEVDASGQGLEDGAQRRDADAGTDEGDARPMRAAPVKAP